MRASFCRLSGSSATRADKYATKLKLYLIALGIDKR